MPEHQSSSPRVSLPAKMISDNGTQLVGAERELQKMIQGWDTEKLRQFGAENGMEWKFITPGAPHQNGCAEALIVKSCKTALRRAVGVQVLTPFELYTILLEVVNLVNQRPIGRIPNDPDDGSYLSPNDILLGRASTDVPARAISRGHVLRISFLYVYLQFELCIKIRKQDL